MVGVQGLGGQDTVLEAKRRCDVGVAVGVG